MSCISSVFQLTSKCPILTSFWLLNHTKFSKIQNYLILFLVLENLACVSRSILIISQHKTYLMVCQNYAQIDVYHFHLVDTTQHHQPQNQSVSHYHHQYQLASKPHHSQSQAVLAQVYLEQACSHFTPYFSLGSYHYDFCHP